MVAVSLKFCQAHLPQLGLKISALHISYIIEGLIVLLVYMK